MTTPATKNENGVYTAGEVLVLGSRKGGRPLAEIRVAYTEGGWRAARSFSFSTGHMWGSSSPISDTFCPPYPTRQLALEAATARMAKQVREVTDPAMQAEVNAILRWLATLNPAQLDMFGDNA